MEKGEEAYIPAGTIFEDKYRIGALIGKGGMGEVYEGTHLQIDKKVAIKRMHPHWATNPTLVQRFQQEAKLAGSIGHDYICEVNDYGTAADGSPYLVMPHLKGFSLGATLKEETKFDTMRGVPIVCQILEALEAAHNHPKRIVHRDLKPDNVFLTTFGGRKDVVKLLDFGIAKVRKASSGSVQTRPGTEPGSVLGTPSYMAPEQARGDDDIDHRADVYAVGAILYEVLTGRPPFKGNSYQNVCVQVIVDQFPPPCSIEPSIPKDVENIIIKAMSKDRLGRYQSAREMRQALEKVKIEAPRKIDSKSDIKKTAPVSGDSLFGPDSVSGYKKTTPLPSTTSKPVISISSSSRKRTFLACIVGIAVIGAIVAIWQLRFVIGSEEPAQQTDTKPENIELLSVPTPNVDSPQPNPDTGMAEPEIVKEEVESAKGTADSEEAKKGELGDEVAEQKPSRKPKKKNKSKSDETSFDDVDEKKADIIKELDKEEKNNVIKKQMGTEFYDDYDAD